MRSWVRRRKLTAEAAVMRDFLRFAWVFGFIVGACVAAGSIVIYQAMAKLNP